MAVRLRTRRQFLASSGAAASVALLGQSLFDLGCGPSTWVRRDIGGLSASDPIVQSYGKAIKKMKALPDSDPLSWTYQAAIHGTLLGGSHTAWNTCEHGTYFFFSWHRMYLWYFERIIRKMSGDLAWALPFWNWESPAERQLPEPFRVPADPSNQLFTANRGFGWNDGTSSLFASTVNTGFAMPLVPFTDFSSSLEGTPHGAVHVSIGGWMGSVPTAAQDPVFWLHHCNIDRLWNIWLAQGGGRTDPLDDATWKNTKFTFFNEHGKQVQLTGCDVLRAEEQLRYKYEGEPAQVKLYCEKILPIPTWIKELLFQLPIPPVLGPGPDPVPWEIDIRESRARLGSVAAEANADLLLELTQIEADRQPDVYYEVHVGLPKDAAPDPQGPYYVGNVALFGHGIRDEHQHGGFKPASLSFKINQAVQAALKGAPSADTLRVLFVPRSSAREGKPAEARSSARIRIGAASFSVRRPKNQPG
ncbi:MAG TPA: tyrosinase family protein [Thermoanaerobaculia bacterium]|nr:tyrosinase family protein [Thermoanaerobaculia bacterium]